MSWRSCGVSARRERSSWARCSPKLLSWASSQPPWASCSGSSAAVILLTVLPGVGLDLPSVTPAIHAVAVLVPLALGAGATLAACVLPALRATSVPADRRARETIPVGEVVRSSHGRERLIGTVTLAVGVGLLLAGLFAESQSRG